MLNTSVQEERAKTAAPKPLGGALDKQARLREFEAYKKQYYSVPREEFLAHDQADAHDPQAVAEYAAECQRHMQATEAKYLPAPTCIKSQADITTKMRQILIEWLVEVHMKFKLLPETLFLTVNIIDRFTQIQQVCRTDYQLLGVAAMLVAAKYEEIYAPEIGDFVYMTDNAYSRDRILQMESEVLRRLDFNFTVPSRFGYLERFVKLSHSDDLVMNFARYITELSLMQVELHKWRPS